MNAYQVVRTCLSTTAVALMLVPPLAQAQSECEQIRRECLDYCRYGPVSPEKGRDCKSQCRKQVEQCTRGERAAEGYPVVGGYPGGAGAPPPYGAPYGAPYYGGTPYYGGAPYYGVPYYGGYGGAPYEGPPATDASQSEAPTVRAPQ